MISSAPSFSLAGQHFDVASFTYCYGLLVCTPFAGGYVASAHPVAQMHWTPATWPSGSYHDRTCTGKPTMTFRTHHASVGRAFGRALTLCSIRTQYTADTELCNNATPYRRDKTW